MNRRSFLQRLTAAAGGAAAAPLMSPLIAPSRLLAQSPLVQSPPKPQRANTPRAYEFVFARLRYASGDWDYNPKVCGNVLDSVLQYTDIDRKSTRLNSSHG